MRVSRWLVPAGAAVVLAFGGIARAGAQSTAPAAQGAQVRRPMAVRWAAVLSRLNLSADQRAKVRALMQKARDETKAVREDTSLTPMQKREKVQGIDKSLREKVMNVLTKEQKARLRGLMNNGQPPRAILARWMLAVRQLDLSPAQKTEVRSAVQDAQAKAKIVRESSLQPAAKRAQTMQIERALRARVMDILTPDQKAKLRAMLKQRQPRSAAAR